MFGMMLSLWVGGALAADRAPDFELPSVDGQGSRALSQARGKVVLLNFWATWCGPCKREMPHLEALRASRQEQGLEVWTINVDDPRTAGRVAPWLARQELGLVALRDADRSVFRRYSPSMSLPWTVLVDRRGEVVERWSGFDEDGLAALSEAVDRALERGEQGNPPAP